MNNMKLVYALAIDVWTVTFGSTRRGLGGAAARPAPSPLFVVLDVTAHPLTASVAIVLL